MDQEPMALTQKQRDRLDVLKQAKRGQITQRRAAELMEVSERWMRKLLQRIKDRKGQCGGAQAYGDRPPTGGGAPKNASGSWLFSQPVYARFVPRWLASIWGRSIRSR